jgi:hypothetical protein
VEIEEFAREIGARFLAGARGGGEIHRLFVGERMSDLLEQAGPGTLLVTRLSNAHLVRLAELMDVPALCLAGGARPSPELLAAAQRVGTAVLVSSLEPEAVLAIGRIRLEAKGEGPG